MTTKLGFISDLTGNSAPAVRNSWSDAGSVAAFVLAADAALVLLFLYLRKFERARGAQEGGGRINMGGGQYSALAKVGLAALACDAALDVYHARRDPASAAFVLASYVVLVVLMGLFVRAFAHARASDQRQH